MNPVNTGQKGGGNVLKTSLELKLEESFPELMRLVNTYSEVTGVSVEDCVAQALTGWLIGPADCNMRSILAEAKTKHYLTGNSA